MRAALVILVVLVGGCTSPPIDSGVEGTVTVGPMCPVERDPPDPDCADRPLAVTLEALRAGIVVATFSSDEAGQYRVALAPGNYTFQDKAHGLPSCHAGPVVVVAQEYTRLDFVCDSGIR